MQNSHLNIFCDRRYHNFNKYQLLVNSLCPVLWRIADFVWCYNTGMPKAKKAEEVIKLSATSKVAKKTVKQATTVASKKSPKATKSVKATKATKTVATKAVAKKTTKVSKEKTSAAKKVKASTAKAVKAQTAKVTAKTKTKAATTKAKVTKKATADTKTKVKTATKKSTKITTAKKPTKATVAKKAIKAKAPVKRSRKIAKPEVVEIDEEETTEDLIENAVDAELDNEQEDEVENSRKAPTNLEEEVVGENGEPKKKFRFSIYSIVTTSVLVVSMVATVFIGYSDAGQIDVTAVIEAKNRQLLSDEAVRLANGGNNTEADTAVAPAPDTPPVVSTSQLRPRKTSAPVTTSEAPISEAAEATSTVDNIDEVNEATEPEQTEGSSETEREIVSVENKDVVAGETTEAEETLVGEEE